MTIIKLTVATLLPALFAVLFYLAEKKKGFAKLSSRTKQILIGLVFGGVAVFATEFGIPVNGAVLNVRTAAPLTAGLLFGGPAGIIAGVIGGVERWFSVLWGGGAYTQLACSLATVMAGFFGAAMRKYMFDNKKASWMSGFAIGLSAEVLHMLLVFITNMSDIHTAFAVVEKCAPLMVLLNALAVALALGIVSLIGKEKIKKERGKKQIAQVFRSGLMLCVLIAFAVTCVFTIVLQTRIAEENTVTLLETGLQEAPENLRDSTKNTLVMYTEWIGADISAAENRDSALFDSLVSEYEVPEIYVVAADGTVVCGNIAGQTGKKVPEAYRLAADAGENVWDYGQSFVSESSMQYTAVALNGTENVLVGYNQSFIVDEVEKRIAIIATNTHIGQSGFLIICDAAGTIVSDGRENTGKALADIGIDADNIAKETVVRTRVDGEQSRLMLKSFKTAAGEYTLIAVLPESEATFARNTSVYIMVFMEILVFAALFINVYFLTKRVVVDNIHKVNTSLARITGGNLDVTVNVRENEEFASLSDDINSTVATLKHYIAEAAARIDKELEFAKAIQHSALPSVFPPYPNRKNFDIFALMDTAKEVGGDFYDFYLLDNDRLGFLVADVSGKGIPAAMFMMTAKTVIKGLAESGMEVDNIFTQANATLCDGNDTGMFVTAWIGILDLRTGLLSFANAGHNPPLIRHKNGSFEFLKTRPNFILAGMKTTKYKKQELRLSPGDEIFLYTDGVTEAKDADGGMFREEKLLEALNRNPDEGVESRCKNVLSQVGAFVKEAEQFDDITMLSVKLNHLQTFDRIVVCPDLESTDAVWEFIDFKIKKAELPRKLATKLKVCTDEIYSNILRYSRATKAEIFCRVEANRLTLIFRDNGVPYDPTAAAEPDISASAQEREIGGLGIYMVKKTAKSLKYEYADSQNILTLTFDC